MFWESIEESRGKFGLRLEGWNGSGEAFNFPGQHRLSLEINYDFKELL